MFYLALLLFTLGLLISLSSSIFTSKKELTPKSDEDAAEAEEIAASESVMNDNSEITPPEDILFLASSIDGFELQDITFTLSEKAFYLDFALEEKEKLANADISFHSDLFFEEGLTLEVLAQKMEVPDLENLINKHRNAVSWNIRKSEQTFSTNHDQFGVYDFSIAKNEKLEIDRIEFVLYHTDYFTHLVMKSVFEELQAKKHPICWATNSNVTMYNLFLTCLETKVAIIDDYLPHAKKFVIAVENEIPKACFSKYLDTQEIDNDGIISLRKWLTNLLAELGLKVSLLTNPESKFYELYFDRGTFTIGFCAGLIFPTSFRTFNNVLSKNSASNLSFTGIVLNRNELHRFIENTLFALSELFCLENVAERQGTIIHSYSKNYSNYKSMFEDLSLDQEGS